MKSSVRSRTDWLVQYVTGPVYVGLLNWILIGPAYWQNGLTFLVATGIGLLMTGANFFANSALVTYTRSAKADPASYEKQLVRRLVVTTLCSCTFFSLPYLIYQLIDLPGFVPDVSRYGWSMLLTVVVNTAITFIYASINNFDQWRQTHGQVDALSKARQQAELDALRQQVNPHFLFNSLNSLTALISEDPQKAEAFSEELSTVYRYLLRSNEVPLVPLTAELDFLHSYYHLLKTRHGDAITLVTHLRPGTEARQLPPLTLQLLIENAVKHNVILPEQPLTINLSTDEASRLVVSNNIQRKHTRALSNGVGLSNILTKYRMLGQPAPVIEDDGREFRVTLPLV